MALLPIKTDTFFKFPDSKNFFGKSLKKSPSTVGRNGKKLIELSATVDWNSTISVDAFSRKQASVDLMSVRLKSQPTFLISFSEI